MTPFACLGDAVGSAVRLGSLWQILLDGANGVSQAVRICQALEPSALIACLVTLIAVGLVRQTGWGAPRGKVIALTILAASFVPGWIHVLGFRADRPSRQAWMTREIQSIRANYVTAMRGALTATPQTTCFVPDFVGPCSEPSGIYLGAAGDLWPWFRCVGGEPNVVIVEVSECSPVNVHARLLP